jgi:SAM-dependent methyltransferase
MRIAEAELDTYDTLWQHEPYGRHSPGAQYAATFVEMTGARAGDTVLDAGCGSGKGALALAGLGYRVTMCDLTSRGLCSEALALRFFPAVLWRDEFAAFEWIYCCDVLEHIPLPFTMLVVHRLVTAAQRGVFLSIALVPDEFGALVGTPLHQSVQSFVAWRDQLAEIADVVECRDLGAVGLYFLRPR